MQFIDLAAQRRRLGDRLKQAIERVVESSAYILGPEVAAFEKQLADYVGVRHVVGCANGTDALLLPLHAFGIGPGDAVFVPSFTFAATAEVVALVRATPVFVDIDPDTYNMSPASLEAAIAAVRREGRLIPRAIIPVDLFGLAADYDAIGQVAAREGLIVIEDAAQSMGGKAAGRKCGAFGKVASTSFFPAKPLGCYGDGGAVFTDDDELADRLRSLAFHGKGATRNDFDRIGINSRLDTIQAAILIEKLAILEEEMAARQAVAARYSRGLKDLVRVPSVPADRRSAWAQYAIETGQRDELQAHLKALGIPTMIYYARPLHLQPAYRDFPCSPSGLGVSEAVSDRILCLPMHPYLGEADQDRIVGAIRDFLGGRGLSVAAE